MIKKHLHKWWPDSKAIKFLGAGILNTVFGYGVYIALLYVGMPYWLALLTSTIMGVVFNYLSFGRLVFNRNESWPVFGRFVVAYALIYCVNAMLLSLLINYLLINPYMGQITCIPICVAMSWIAMHYWVYKKNGS